MKTQMHHVGQRWISYLVLATGALITLMFSTYALIKISKANHRYQHEILSTHLENLASRLELPLSEVYRSALITSNSLALRRFLININQDNIRTPNDNLISSFNDLAQKWHTLSADSPDVLSVTDSLEARFLKDVKAYSNGLIDSILVTDVFGTVRVATSKPDRFMYFSEPWWQETLLAPPGAVYLSPINPTTPTPSIWTWSIPLRTDDGVDSVGIIRFDIRIGKLLEHVLTTETTPDIISHIITQEGLIYPPVLQDYRIPLPTLVNYPSLEIMVRRDETNLMLQGRHFQFKSNDGFQGHDWLLVAITPSEPLLSLSNRSVQQVFFLAFCCFCFILITVVLVDRGSNRPLSMIDQTIHAINLGNLKARLPIEGSSAVQNVFVAFNSMISRLSDRVTRLQIQSARSARELDLISEFLRHGSARRERQVILESLLQIAIRHSRAESGMVTLYSEEKSELIPVGLYSIDPGIPRILITLVQHASPQNPIFLYAWTHTEGRNIWEQGYQVIWVTPILADAKAIGHVILLFKHAPEENLGADALIGMLCRITTLLLRETD